MSTSLRRGTNWGWAHASLETNGMNDWERQVSIGGSAIKKQPWEATGLPVRMSGHTGGVHGVTEACSVFFSLTVDFVLTFFFFAYGRTCGVWSFSQGSNALLENVMIDRDYRNGLAQSVTY